MFSPRLSCLLLNWFLALTVLQAFTNFVFAFLLTGVAFLLIQVYRIPAIPSESLRSRFQQTTGSGKTKDKQNIILHRAGVYDSPENTLEGVKLAHECGVGGVEVDLEFTADGVGVLFHDSTLDRTTDGSGPICHLSYEEVRKLDAAAKHACRSKTGPMQIPCLEECIQECLKLDLTLYIDCKSQPEKTAELLVTLFKKYPALYNKAIVCSFYPQVIYSVRRKDPSIVTGLTHRRKVLSTVSEGVLRNKELWKKIVSPVLDVLLEWSLYSWVWYLCGNSYFLMQKDNLSRHNLNFWTSLGIQVIPWTVNDPREKELFTQSFNCPIITDGMETE
ncbi:glycerophosphodiester phosphodiesterase 1-like [Haliotis cracherodii]|uniref:glycerophosphodiester phosphodiesterase 1-like n=1 Tax=Haliotis cracherodii TaxID=6455 RepID=UPI0039ED0C2D